MRVRAGLLAAAGVIAAAAAEGQTVHVERTSTETVVYVDLQNAPRSFEPVDEPTRIRVNDRSSVRIHVRNLSPLDVCSLTSRTPTPTTITNPIEAVLPRIGPFAFGGVNQQKFTPDTLKPLDRMSEVRKRPGGIGDDAVFHHIHDLQQDATNQFNSLMDDQLEWQRKLSSTLAHLNRYLADDYRGAKWSKFDPTGPELDDVRNAYTKPLPTVLTAARLQGIVDTVADGATYLKGQYTDPEAEHALDDVRELVAYDKAIVGIVNANNTALTTMQGTLQTNYLAAVKLHDDLTSTMRDRSITREARSARPEVLAQDFVLGTDRQATITGVVSCVSAVDGKTPTTDPINYSVLYQDIPRLTSSVGLLTTFLDKVVIGTTPTSAHPAGEFAVTDSGEMQVLPMAYVNYRIGSYVSTRWPSHLEDEVPVSAGISGGFGINPNSGTNEPEVFAGGEIALGRLIIHPGVHWGRVQTLSGGFNLGDPLPDNFSGSAPVAWHYKPAFSIGFSVRVAPF